MNPLGRPAVDWHTRFAEVDGGYVTPCLRWQGSRVGSGYGQVRIGGRIHGVHRLVWSEAHGDPGRLHVLHHCDNKWCGRLDHLFLGTHADNMADLAAKGYRRATGRPGTAHHATRLTEDDVRLIRLERAHCSLRELAQRFGLSEGAVSMIVNRKTWRHVA